MKGVVFTEFMELVENKFGLAVVDKIVSQTQTSTDGAYTSVGTYDHQELIGLVSHLHRVVGAPISALIRAFGKHLLHRLASGFPQLFANVSTLEEFLPTVENVIHVEVRKLYPDAELPSLTFEKVGAGRYTMEYRSNRPFADLAEGLLLGSAEHFGEEVEITREDVIPGSNKAAKFTIVSLKRVESCLTMTC